MTLQVAIIADDLTGALDTGTPFVEVGLTVAVAIEIDALSEALIRNPDVVVVNTASRGLSAGEAATRMQAVLAVIQPVMPPILFKKIDSRLKGNVAAESVALAEGTGRRRIVVAPAIPDQQRFTIDGAVTGRGVDVPLAIRPLFDASSRIEILDASTDEDLDGHVSSVDWPTVIAVGARGLGSAIARSLGNIRSVNRVFSPTAETLFAFGSRDPMTTAQIEHFASCHRLVSIIDAVSGVLPETAISRLPAVARCVGALTSEPGDVAQRFADGVRQLVDHTRPDMLMMGGGDTALAILTSLGVLVLLPIGEISAGVPWFEIEAADGRKFRCAVKSGGFGDLDSLLKLIPENLLDQTTSTRTMSEKQTW